MIARMIAAQRGHLFCWVPVVLSIGIGAYFALPIEPSRPVLLLAGMFSIAALLAATRVGETLGPVVIAVALAGAGFGWAGLRAHQQAAPVLSFRYYGPIEGRVVQLDRSASDKLRLTLDQVVLRDVPPARTPERVRVALHGEQGFITPVPGLRVILTGHLSPSSGPVEPGGFDFQRHAWFQRIGAVGYTRTPVLALSAPESGAPWMAVGRARLRLSLAVQAALPGQTGAMAAAIVTGDRSALSRDTLDRMRDSNLAHLLAISGLHVGLLTGVVFAAIRTALALVPRVALRVPGKKWAALGALAAAAGYLVLSGGTVSTQRAFIMAAVMLTAVLADRRAITLRAVALAAVIVLVLRPEALLSPGFQMSFAATTALVWVFGHLRLLRQDGWPRPVRVVSALVLSSAVAGLATAPFAAAHFNQSSTYGLAANLVAVPIMGSIVAPAAVLAGVLAPLGLADPAIWVMGKGIGVILWVAGAVAALPGAVRYIPSAPPVVLPLLCLGALWLILWRGRMAAAGALPVAAAIALWVAAERPALLIADSGGLVGLMLPDGRALNKPKGDGFQALAWLENDGMSRDRAAAFARAEPWVGDKTMRFSMDPATIIWVGGRATSCDGAQVVIASRAGGAALPCLRLGPEELARSGTLAVAMTPEGPRVRATRAVTGARLWNSEGRFDDPSAQIHAANTIAEALEAALRAPTTRLASRDQ
ncbi:MAG: ComEC family competence protein [Rhodobacteraceae bacterium]|nr:ComEC family competence protein [Paracoccaceae bacterium]